MQVMQFSTLYEYVHYCQWHNYQCEQSVQQELMFESCLKTSVI